MQWVGMGWGRVGGVWVRKGRVGGVGWGGVGWGGVGEGRGGEGRGWGGWGGWGWVPLVQLLMLSDKWLQRYRHLENFNTETLIFEDVLDFDL